MSTIVVYPFISIINVYPFVVYPFISIIIVYPFIVYPFISNINVYPFIVNHYYLSFYCRPLLYPCSPKGEGGILFYLCPSFRPSKIFFVTLFSVTVDGRNLIFGHKRHIGIPYCG